MNTRINPLWDDVNNLPLILKNSARNFPSLAALTSEQGVDYNYEELELAARHIAVMLKSAGIGHGDKVAILSENSPHWVISYFGILATGATTVPVLPDFQGSEVLSILEHAEAKSLFVSGKLLSRLNAGLPPAVEMVFNTDDFQLLELKKGELALTADTPGTLKKLKVDSSSLGKGEGLYEAEENDLASIIYTSGTTGRSKGVMLTHQNILSNAKSSWTVHAVKETDRFLSMLPLAHSYESTIGTMIPLLNGARVHYMDKAPTPSYLKPILQKVRPTTMLTVPLIIEKIYRASVRPALTKSPAMRMLMKLGFTRRLLSKAAANKLLKFFGGQIRFFGVGGAPLAPDVEKFLIEGKFPYAIGYGLTETSPMISGFGPADAVYKSVGTVMEGITVKIENPDPLTQEGEIVVSGPNVMQGYYKDKEKTAEVFTSDGFFRTGDLGYWDKNGILYIRGRSKNMILGPNGENIYPEEIEAVINSREIVSESLVMEYKGLLVARVHLKLEEMEKLEERFKHLKENAVEFQKQLQAKADEMLAELMTNVNQHVARNSKLQMIILQMAPFEKTPTLKIKRFLYKQLSPA
jgi:long-chain acyl-CoA synthetase